MSIKIDLNHTQLNAYERFWSDVLDSTLNHNYFSNISCGVPQGSVLGSIIFYLYMLPLGSIILSHFRKPLKQHVFIFQVMKPSRGRRNYDILSIGS